MEIVFLWFALSIVAAVVAGNKGRSAFGFFLLALFLSPLIGLLAAFAASPHRGAIEQQQIVAGGMKKCPYCAELVKSEAIVCRYCQRELAAAKSAEHTATAEP